MKKTYACPSCGAQLIFQSAASVFAVCSFCKSSIVRNDVDLKAYGKMAELPPDVSPLQIGTTGVYQKRMFQIVGRLKLAWENGTWNEWYVLFNDGSSGWLAEAQGSLMMSFEETPTPRVPASENIKTGDPIHTKAGSLVVRDIKQAECIGSEGELPMKAPKGRTSLSADMDADPNLFGTVDYGPEGIKVYTGLYVEFDELELQNLREIDGWR